MARLIAKIRGVIGLGLVGGLVGFLGGGLWGLLSSVLRSGVVWDSDYLRFLIGMAVGNAVGFMKIGGFTAAGFGLLLASIESRRSLEELPLWRMALFGALVGASFPAVYVTIRSGLSTYVGSAASFLPAMAALGLIGGVLSVSLVTVAKRAHRAELSSVGNGGGSLAETSDES